MIRTVQISNFKSIAELEVELGRVTVLIGANGSGKSNILEAIAFASAAVQDKLDNEFLVSRGIRVTETRFMRAAFETTESVEPIRVSIHGTGFKSGNVEIDCQIRSDESVSYPKWKNFLQLRIASEQTVDDDIPIGHKEYVKLRRDASGTLPQYIVFSPENSALRQFQAEGQLLPLGIKGEGLFAHLKGLANSNRDRLQRIKERLQLIDWFETFEIPESLGPGERSIQIRDRYLSEGAMFDQRSANEGFLFLLFYVTLLISPDTPGFFAIDNIDSSLNPKLCTTLLQQLMVLAKEFDKQVILTTHNPAVLDGLDLRDPEQRLMVVDRNQDGHTKLRRISAPKVAAGQVPVSLSEAFLRGYIGGLPNNF